MGWSEAVVDGAVLASAVQEDRGAERAVPYVVSSAARRLARRASWLAELDGPTRRAALLRLVRQMVPPLPASLRGSPRLLGLLASEAPEPVRRRWAAAAPMPRAGYRPAPGLRRALRRRGAAWAAADPAVADAELGAGRAALAALWETADELERRRWSALAGPEETAAVASLRALGGGERLEVPRVRRWARAAERLALAGQFVRVLGAVRLGWEHDGPGDGSSWRWRRVGGQLRELEDCGCLG